MNALCLIPILEDISPHALHAYCGNNQIVELYVFGSVLRHGFAESSDIDVMVVFEPEARVGLLTLARIQRELTDLLGRQVDIVVKSGLKPIIRDQVLADSVIIYAA